MQAGDLIAARYRLIELIGRGGMAEVWHAEHLGLKSPVAVKFLDETLIPVSEMMQRFQREARSAAAVRHTHIAQIFDYGVDGGRPFIVMEKLEGESLEARLDKHGKLTPAELVNLFDDVALGVGHAHAQGVVHRDLKPANIFLIREGGRELTKVLDFGIAKVFDGGRWQSTDTSTSTGVLLGTPDYMSPEQARGRDVDQRSDLWALAVLAFECLTGRLPFQGRTAGDLLVEICSGEPLIVSELMATPKGLDAWFEKGFAKDPSGRFSTASEMARDLRKLLSPASGSRVATLVTRWDEGEARSARASGASAALGGTARRYGRRLGAGLALGGGLVLVAWYVLESVSATSAPPTATPPAPLFHVEATVSAAEPPSASTAEPATLEQAPPRASSGTSAEETVVTVVQSMRGAPQPRAPSSHDSSPLPRAQSMLPSTEAQRSRARASTPRRERAQPSRAAAPSVPAKPSARTTTSPDARRRPASADPDPFAERL